MENPNRVLISEDTDLWQGIFARLLADRPFELHQARDLATTIFDLDKYFFNVVIVDLALDPIDESRLDGIETIRKIRKLDEGTHAIVLTGRGTVELAVAALREFQVYHFVEKEKFDRETFLETLQEASTKAYWQAAGPGRILPPEPLIGPVDWHRFSSMLQVQEKDLRDVFCGLVRQCMPIRFRGKAIATELTAAKDALTAEFWSKWFGRAVRILAGKKGHVTRPPEHEEVYSYQLDTTAGIIAGLKEPFERYFG